MNRLILLIDDDADEVVLFSSALTIAGLACDYVYAESVPCAMEMLEQITPAYIFVDVNMPKIGGLAFVSFIRKQPRFDAIPVIVYSTAANAELYAQAIKLGANDCIRKEDSLKRQAEHLARVLNTY